MVSFQALVFSNSRKANTEFDHLSKRKREDKEDEETFEKRPKETESTKSIFDIELQLETPLPLEWDRCLDIQSRQIHFSNTRSHKKTSEDPRRSPEPPSPDRDIMSLDLELNLPCDSRRKNQANSNNNFTRHNSGSPSGRRLGELSIDINREKKKSGELTRCPSWLAFEGDEQEMVATACMRCHMLVILCKSSPACPNCKFMHPADQSSPKLFKQNLSLLC